MNNVIASGLLLVLACSSSSRAQTMAVSVDPDRTAGASPYVQVFDIALNVPFDVVVWLNSEGSDGQFAEFVVTDLQESVPGLFKIATVTIGDPLDLEFKQPGEFKLIYGECMSADSQLELARVSYADFTGILGADFVMTVRGFGPGDSDASIFGGVPGFVDCSDIKVYCEMGGTTGGVTGAGVVFPPGALILNATPLVVPVDDGSMGQLKAKFD